MTDDATVSRRAVGRQDYLSISNQTKVAARGGGVDYDLGHQGGGACVHLITGAELTNNRDIQRLRTPQGEQTGRLPPSKVQILVPRQTPHHLEFFFLHSKINSASSCWSRDGQHSSISDEYTKHSHRNKQYSKSITM